MHAIGQAHEQSRSDRDDYIDVFYSNIVQGQEQNFNNNNPTFDRTPYDAESLMQYPLNVSFDLIQLKIYNFCFHYIKHYDDQEGICFYLKFIYISFSFV